MAFESPFSPSPSSATFSSPQSYIPSLATPSFLSGHQTMIFFSFGGQTRSHFLPSSFLSVPRFRMLHVMSLYLCLWCHMQYRFHNSSHTLMGNAHGMGLGRQVVYPIPSSYRPYPFLISSIPRERRRDPVTHSPVPLPVAFPAFATQSQSHFQDAAH